ncbi:unnamed protein product [Cyclocybe aegerita]|uniref:Uncharacterized protein n=1 Tax=Cyclocybe aegerita TaxID=1973307 RepID=A0A8S0XKA9_CYCAE|nr:unnamed protein product [Cyclocybe aegerita]
MCSVFTHDPISFAPSFACQPICLLELLPYPTFYTLLVSTGLALSSSLSPRVSLSLQNATMEENRPARRTSGMYDAHYGSTQSLQSGASLRGHAAPPAGVATATPAGVVPAAPGAISGWEDPATPTPAPPPAPVPFYKKRWFIISQIIIIPLGIALLFILLFPVVRAIVQLVLRRSNLDVQVAIIGQPVNNSFGLTMEGYVYNTGIFSAKIQFTEPTNVSWIESDGTETPLGYMQIHDLSAKHKRAVINDTTVFHIIDEEAFGRFSGSLITSQNFTWRLVSYNLRVQALKFPVAKGLTFDKRLTMNGFNSFDGNVVLRDFQLPSDNPEGGINFVAVTELVNPSPFSIDLGTVVFALSYEGVALGLGTGTGTKINPGNNTITLSGTLERQTQPSDLVIVSQLFTRYLNGESSPVIAKGRSTLQSDGSSISWLSQGLQDLELNVPFKAFAAIDPIRSVTIGEMELQFSQDQPWSPAAESTSVQAALQLPFGFSLEIGQIQNEFMITKDGNNVAGLSTPLGASRSSVTVLSPTDTTGTINISITDTRLSCPEPQHAAFASFNELLTNSDVAEFRLVGESRAIANMSIGQITLDPIKVNVSTSLKGLQGLKGMTTIESVDVTGGSTTGINLGIGVTINNPSNLVLSTGDLTLQLSRDGAILGTALMPNLTLSMGNNTVNATSSFAANGSPQGLQTLNDFVGQKDVQLTISGFDGSTEVTSLAQAFRSLSLDVTLPALKTNLLNSASLEILPTTGRENNIAHVIVSLENPFSAPLTITKVTSTVTSFGIPLGSIEQEVTFNLAPKSTTESPSLNLDMNFDPSALFTVTRALAVEAGLDVAPLDSIVQIGGYQYLSTTSASKREITERQSDLFQGFDLTTFVGNAFKQLKSDVQLSTDVTIGEYQTTLTFSQEGLPTKTDDTLDLILPILAEPIVQKIVGESLLGLDTVLILNPEQNGFQTRLRGTIRNAGPFDATISFPSGLTISWQGRPIGKVAMSEVTIVGDIGGTIDAESRFEVLDASHLTEFTKTLLTAESFTWDISGENLTVNALGISVAGIAFSSRSVTLKGFNGLQGGVTIQTFDLPSDDPAGGIHLTLETTAANPSQVGIQLSSLGFNTFVDGVMIAPVASAGSVTLAPTSTSALSLVGRLIPQDNPAGLAVVSKIFNNFVEGKDSNVIVQGASAGSSDITWLNEGIKALQIATILPNRGPQNIIKSIALNELTLMFSSHSPFAPSTSSKSTDAAFTLPFAFPIDISALQQTLTLGFQGTNFAELAIPKGPSTTDVEARVIHLGFSNVPLAVFDSQRSTFEQFVTATTVGSRQTLRLSGSADADARTAVGVLSLKGIAFSVDSDIAGLQGLASRPVTVANLDVNHGFPDYLLIKVDSALFNPSNLTIGTGDVSFSLQFQDQTIGSADIDNLVVSPGNASYPIDVHYAPQGGAVGAGRTLLQNYIQGVDSQTTIAGSTVSTPIQSLQQALSRIHLSPVTIAGIHQNLIESVSLVFPLNIVDTGIASTAFRLVNPFTASINLLRVSAVASFHGITLGTLPSIDASAHPIRAEGHGSVTSPALPLNFNLNPINIVQLLLSTSQANGVDLGPLIQMFQFLLANPDFKPPVKTTVDTQAPTCVSGNQFDAAGAILKSLAGLKVDLAVESSVKLDDFATELAFSQTGVLANTDRTALFLVGAVSGPVAQNLVDGAVLSFSESIITNISNDGFDLALKGSLTNIGPLDAVISFPEPVTVTWEGKDIAQIALLPICAAANTGLPTYETNARLTITESSGFTEFATFLLHEPSFEWTISTPKLRVAALGTIFDNVSLSKKISLKAFNGLPGITISNFQLPSDDAAGGIHIETDASIPSEAQIGIDLGSVTFQSFFKGTLVGPLAAEGLVLRPSSVADTHLSGRIVPQSGGDLDVMGELFSGYLNGQNLTLQTKGYSVQGANGPVEWLSTAFKTLTIDVILPGEKLQVIEEINLNDLSVTLKSQDQAFAPPTSSKNTVAKYRNPFGFSLQVVRVGQTIVLGSHGVQIAQLVIPPARADGGVSTGNSVDLNIVYTDVPLQSLNNAAFQQLFAAVTLTSDLEVELTGAADVLARTTIGDVPISGVPIDVTSHLKGIASFGGNFGVSDVIVAGSGGAGGSEYVKAPLKTTLQNPSNISLDTVGVSLPVLFNGVAVGRAALDEFALVPGSNVVDTEFRYQPANPNDTVAQAFLAEFIQTGNQIDLVIDGDLSSSPFASLAPALANLRLAGQLTGLNEPTFITQIAVIITLESLITNLVSVDFTLHNPLDADLVIEFVQSDSGVNGLTYAQFSQPFSNFVVPAGATVHSGEFPNVLLTQGAIASLDIIPLGYLDVQAAVTLRVGQGGYQVPYLKLSQNRIPTTYDLVLGFAAMKNAAISASLSASGSETASSTSDAAVSTSGGPASTSEPATATSTVNDSDIPVSTSSDDFANTTTAITPAAAAVGPTTTP